MTYPRLAREYTYPVSEMAVEVDASNHQHHQDEERGDEHAEVGGSAASMLGSP